MAIHQKAFQEELYIEHLEEAAFQYETRLAWLQDKEVGWQDLQDIDVALEAHLDALIVGEKLALDLCLNNLADAEAAMMHVIVRVFCRYRLINNLSMLWKDFDFDDQAKITAVADALKWECPQEWLPHLIKVYSSNNADMYPVLAPSVAQYSRDSGSNLLYALSTAKDKDLPLMIKAISLCNKDIQQSCISVLTPYLNHSDIKVVAQSAETLMVMGDNSVLSKCKDRIEKLPYIFALGGGVAENQLLLEFAKKGTADEDCLLTLGLLGSIDAIQSLLGYLKHPDYAPVAAQALQLISDASLYEDVHEADEVEEDELFEHEIEAFKKGELPKNIDGNPFGAEVRQLSINQAIWFDWFKSNQSRFTKGLRYRNGKPFSPSELLNNLIDNQTPFLVRSLAYSELTIRYGLSIPLSVDDLVHNQQKQLNEIHAWVAQNKSLYTDGSWYFNAQVM